MSISDTLLEYVANEILESSTNDLTVDTPLLELNVLDSIEILSLVEFIQRAYVVTVPFEAMLPTNFDTIRHISELVASLREEKES